LAVAVVSNPVPPSEPEISMLTPEIVEDDEAIAEVVDAFIAKDGVARARLGDVSFHQDALRLVVEPDVWQLALRLDEAVTGRWADLAVGIARWAFEEGRKHPIPHSVPTPAVPYAPPRGAV
jgi:hypothetical protein